METLKTIFHIDIPEATGRRKRMIEATDKAQERKRKILNKWKRKI